MADTTESKITAAHGAHYPTGDRTIEPAGFDFDMDILPPDLESLSVAAPEKTHNADNNYVLLLIDLHSHLFSDFLTLRGGQTLGRRDMKEQIEDAVKNHIDTLEPSVSTNYRTVVRGYYDLGALDEQMRDDFARFAATLSTMDPHFDLTYVLGESAVEQKIHDLYTAATKDENCKHIFIAAWGRPSYLHMLQTPTCKATLVKGPTMKSGIQILPLAMPIVDLPLIFRTVSEENQCELPALGEVFQQHALYRLLYTQNICATNECGFPHTSTQPPSPTHAIQKHELSLPGSLPAPNRHSKSSIPLNSQNERLDTFFPLPNAAAKRDFFRRFPAGSKYNQPCNWHHLSSACRDILTCPFSHAPLPPNILLYLRFRTSLIPCTDGSQCRRADCFFGHVCRMEKCTRMYVPECGMRAFHRVERGAVRWVEGTVVHGKLL